MSELANNIEELYPMKYRITRHPVQIYDKNMNVIGAASIGSELILRGRTVDSNGEILQILVGSNEDHMFLVKDSEFAGGDDAEVIANDIETNTEDDCKLEMIEANARVADMSDTLYGPGEMYTSFNRLQKGQKVIVNGSITVNGITYVTVYQKAKKGNDIKYLGFIDASKLSLEAYDPEPVKEEIPVEEKVDAVVEMEEGPKKEALKEEIRGDILSDDVLVYAFLMDTEIKRANVMKRIGNILEDGCAVCEEGSASTYAELVASGFAGIPSDYKQYLYVIIPRELSLNLKKKMISQGLKPIITERR